MQPGRLRLMAGVLSLAAMAVPVHAATITIVMENLVISPAEATAKVGDTIEWVNKDVVAHTATAKNGDFDVMMPPTKTVTYVVKKAGSVDYYCRFHPNMKAMLKIEREPSP
ncbi:cupredoxin domain-containing protein [Bradyrhizobium cenepequi]